MPRPPSVRRSLASRCFGTLLALWFAISIAEPQWLHACPMHNAPASGDAPAGAQGAHHAKAGDAGGASSASRAAHAGHAAHAAHASPAVAAPVSAHATHRADPAGHVAAEPTDGGVPSHGHDSAHCLCLGDCAPGVAVTLGAAPEVPVATVVVIEPRGALPRADYVPVVRERTLPFATAPPAL